MRALRLTGPGTIELQDVPIPEPGPGQVLVKVAGAGLCHSDLHVLEAGDVWPVFDMTMGHEGSGTIAKLGEGVSDYSEGDPVLLSVLWECGTCRACAEGRGNACMKAGRLNFPTTPGLGPDGSMAEYVLVGARNIDHLGDLDPSTAAPLADAGVTPMHAIRSAGDRLGAGSTAVVLGLGGLGHMGLQILKASTGAKVFALDTTQEKLDMATGLGADVALLSDAAAAETILAATDGYGVDAVFDFVGVQPSVDLARAVIAPEGILRFVGLGGGNFTYSAAQPVGFPWGVNIQSSFGGTHADQLAVIELAQRGQIHIETKKYALDDWSAAFEDLEHGRLPGRAVLIP
ncbi:MAG: alcohol dehydrogenase catalytic domain-containing protein [Beutenbergiaceae bacterium]